MRHPRASTEKRSAVTSRPKLAHPACVLTFGAILAVCGCRHAVAPITKNVSAFSTAASLVVDNSTNAYRAANDLHDQEQISAGVIKVETGQAWDFHNISPLISPDGMKARTDILEALKSYAQSLAELTPSTDSSALTSASTSTGSNLKTLGATIKADPVGAKTGFSVDTQAANAVSTATLALGEYLEQRKVKQELPAITRDMDPHIEALCKLLTDDINTIRAQSKKDHEDLMRQQWVFIQMNREKMSGTELRDEVGKLATELRNEQATDNMLADLHSAIGRLAMTHHALAAAAQGDNPEALNARIADLSAAGANLAHYYQGLPSK